MNIEMAYMWKKFNIFLFSFLRADLLLSSLVHESALIPARLIMEHCMLVAALHANVGTEVGRVTTCHVSHVMTQYVKFLYMTGWRLHSAASCHEV